MQTEKLQSPPAPRVLRRLMLLIALFYVADGLAQPGGLINQSLTLYLKESLGWTADQVSLFLSAMVLPLVTQPFYGLLSDSFPILGYRRKSYLVATNLLAVVGYVFLIFVS